MDYEQYKKMRHDILDECKRHLDALDMVWQRFQKLKHPTEIVVGGNEYASESPSFSSQVRTVIDNLGMEFTANDIEQGLVDHKFLTKEKIERLSITNTLHRLFRRGEIELVRKGAGRMGSVYKKKTPSQ